jgi:DNA-directed RNA polymerase specialized sigma24 family protein
MPDVLRRHITDRQLAIITPYLRGKTKAEAGMILGLSPETVASALVTVRRQLRAEGYKGTHTAIGLRAALRTRGDIDHIDWI